MAITILPRQQTLAGSVGRGLEALAGMKLNEVQQRNMQRQQAGALQGLQGLNISPEEAQAISVLPPELQKQLLRHKIETPQNEEFARGVRKLTGGEEIPGQLGTETSNIPPQLNAKQAKDLAELGFKKQEVDIRRQNAIENSNKPYVNRITEAAAPAHKVKTLIGEIRDLANNPQANIGAIKSLTPNRFQNDVTQALVSKLNELVLQKAQLGKGVPSRQRLALEQASKVAEWQKPGAINYLLDSFDAATDYEIMPELIKDQIIQENNGMQPRNLESLVKKRQHILEKYDLPPVSEYSDDTIIKVDGKSFLRGDFSWVPL
jgi:hypothetical protein